MNLKEILTPEEMQAITASSDLHGAWLVLCQWALVAAIFVGVAWWTNPLTVLLAIWLLGGRQLGFGVLAHECGHRTLFRTQRLNQWVGDWLIAPPTFNNIRAYMRGHLQHHRFAGTPDDPDLPNYRDYPITRARLRRKLLRDLTGRTGWRTVRGIGQGLANLRTLSPEARGSLLRGVGVNLSMLLVLAAFGAPWLYLLWVAALVFANPLISRVRQVAEHGAVPDLYDLDARKNTRTLRAGWLARLVFCPHQINYHLEHHLLASVPIYRLRTMHRMLDAKGCYDGVEFPRGYWQLLRRVTSADKTMAAA
ncbi:MAG: fatty acid desaturase family protein [Pseudomonadales bacterium]